MEIATDLEPATLYIFNDDDQYHAVSFSNNEKGNAVIKRWNKYISPKNVRSAGICTGLTRKAGGFKNLTLLAKDKIDRDIKEIKELLDTGKYNKIKYSANAKGELGSKIFIIGPDVKKYIVDSIKELSSEQM